MAHGTGIAGVHKCSPISKCIQLGLLRCCVVTLTTTATDEEQLLRYKQQHAKLTELRQVLPHMPFELVLSNHMANPPPRVCRRTDNAPSVQKTEPRSAHFVVFGELCANAHIRRCASWVVLLSARSAHIAHCPP